METSGYDHKLYGQTIQAVDALAGAGPYKKPGTYVDSIVFEGHFREGSHPLQALNAKNKAANPQAIQSISSETHDALAQIIDHFQGLQTQEAEVLGREAQSLSLLAQLSTDLRTRVLSVEEKTAAIRDLHQQMHGEPLEYYDPRPTQMALQESTITQKPIPTRIQWTAISDRIEEVARQAALEAIQGNSQESMLQEFLGKPGFGLKLKLNVDRNLPYGGFSSAYKSPSGESTLKLTCNPNKYRSLADIAQFLAHEGFAAHGMNSAAVSALTASGQMHPAAQFGIMGASGRATLLEGVATSTADILGDSLAKLGIPYQALLAAQLKSQNANLLRHNVLALLAGEKPLAADQAIEKLKDDFSSLDETTIRRFAAGTIQALSETKEPRSPQELINEIFTLFYFPNYATGAKAFAGAIKKDRSKALSTAWYLNGLSDYLNLIGQAT